MLHKPAIAVKNADDGDVVLKQLTILNLTSSYEVGQACDTIITRYTYLQVLTGYSTLTVVDFPKDRGADGILNSMD